MILLWIFVYNGDFNLIKTFHIHWRRTKITTILHAYLLSLDVLAVEVASRHQSLAQSTQFCYGVTKVLYVQVQGIQLLQHRLQM